MRKFLSLVLAALLLCCSFSFAMAEVVSDEVYFDADIMNALDQDAESWFTNAETRAMGTILLALDFSLTIGNDSPLFPDMSEPTYIGRDGDYLVVYVHTSGNDVILLYDTSTGEAAYMETSGLSSAVIEDMLNEVCEDGYYENDITTMLTVAQELSDIINGDD